MSSFGSRKLDGDSGSFSSIYGGEKETQQSKGLKKEMLTERISFLTRSLVKNNVILQNTYIVLLAFEYLSMMYYILRLADAKSFNSAFSIIERFLDVTMNENGVQLTGIGGETEETIVTDYMTNKATVHLIINLAIMSSYVTFVFIFINRLFEIKNFDQTQEQSYVMKFMSVFMVLTSTVAQMPVFISIFVVIKALTMGIITKLSIVMIFSNTLLIFAFVFVLIYSLRFFNLEIPNDEIPWSHNQTSGIYLKVLLKIALCTQELYRGALNERIVLIIVLGFILALEGFILIYRMNTPNIFNTIVHATTLFMESLMVALTIIGIIALITEKDILSTLAYLFIFIPVIVKIFYAIDERRKHYVLFKLKNEETLTSNEYLIALTHLLKMVKRQSEVDVAQLLSFTYYHKIFCYDTQCICQFFTQYCQDPNKFKNKKKRTYQGYVDDGVKLLQEKTLQDLEQQQQQQQQRMQQTSVPGPSVQNYLENQMQQTENQNNNNHQITNHYNQLINRASSDSAPMTLNTQQLPVKLPMLGLADRVINSGRMDTPNNNGTSMNVNAGAFITQADPLVSNNGESILESGGGYGPHGDQMSAITRTKEDVSSNREDNEFTGGGGNQSGEKNVTEGNMTGQSNVNLEHKEAGIMLQMVKGTILSGSAYNGYDSNLDFKVKNEFKSPSQFKTLHECRMYFFTRLLEMMFRQLESRTSKNTSFNLIYIYFHYTYQHNVYLSINTLVKLSRSLRRSLFSRMTFAVSEYYLLELVQAEFRRNTKDEIDYSSFIKSNQMSQKLDWLFEDAATDIIQFWSIFKEENANVEKAYLLGLQISQNVKQIRDFTITLEERELIKDYNKYYYYAMFYQNLLNDKQAYNQMIQNLKNLIMVRNMRKKNTRFGTTMNDINDVGFAIFSYDDDKTIGRFSYCNKIACQIFGVSEERILGESVVNLMPELVRIHHDQFVKRFQQEGMPRLFGRVRNMFVKDFSDYVVPVQFYINFHYSSQFSYSLILHVDPIQSVNYFGSQSSAPIPIKHCMFFLCDNYNVILNFTSNTKKLIGFSHKVKKEQEEIIGRQLKMDDIVQQIIKLESQIEANGLKFLPNQILNVRNFRSTHSDDHIPCSLTFQEIDYLQGFPGEFSERIYMVIPCNRVPDIDAQSSTLASGGAVRSAQGNHSGNSNVSGGANPNSMEYGQGVNSSDNSDNPNGGDANITGLSASVSSISSTSSRGSSSSILNNTKSLLFSSRSPKILKLYLYIVFSVFLSFMIVTSINFVIYMQKKNTVDLKIQFNQMVNKRSTFMASSILSLKQLHMISVSNKKNYMGADTSKPESPFYAMYIAKQNFSNIFKETRFNLFGQELTRSYDGMQDYHHKFKRMDQRYSKDLGTNTNQDVFKSINISLVGDNGRLYVQNNTLDSGISLLLTQIGMINMTNLINEEIPLDILDYLNQIKKGQTVSSLFRTLYFIYHNGMTSLNALGQVQEGQIQMNTIKTSDQSKLFVNLISFISIGVITMIGVFSFPLLGKIEDRKISVLKFFNLLNIQQIQELIDKGKSFQAEFETMTRSNDGLLDQDAQDEQNEEGDDRADIDFPAMASGEQSGKTKGQSDIMVNNFSTSTFNPKEMNKKGVKQSRRDNKSKGGYDDVATKNIDNDDQDDLKKGVRTSSGAVKPSGTLTRGNSGNEISNIMRKIRKNDLKADKKDQQKKKAKKDLNSSMSPAGYLLKNAFENDNKGGKKGKGKGDKYKVDEEIKEDGGKKVGKKSKGGKKEKAVMYASKESMGRKAQDLDIDEGSSGEHEKKKPRRKKSLDVPSEEQTEDSQEDHSSDSKKNHHAQDGSPESWKSRELKNGQITITGPTNRSDVINEKVEKIALREKLKLASYVLVVLIFLNSCLLICFYLGQKTFQDDSKTLYNLATFYHRENCLDNLMLYTLEQFVQNRTISLELTTASKSHFEIEIQNQMKDAAQYYLDKCQGVEQDYNDLRKNLPAFMIDVQDQIDSLESSNLCAVTYRSTEKADMRALCEMVYDEILKRGLTSTIYMIFNYAQQLTVRFQKELEFGRSAKFLIDRLYDNKVKDIVDLIIYFLHDTLFYMDDLITSNALAYFNQLANYYLIIFVTYMASSVVMTFVFGLVIFKKVKQQIMTSANILAIMPLDDLDHKEKHKIDQFLNS